MSTCITATADITNFVPFHVSATTFTTDVGVVVDITPVDLSTHLAPDHQDYTPNHRKQRRGKHKRSGR